MQKLKRKIAFLLAVVIVFTTAFVFPDFSLVSMAAEDDDVIEETVIEDDEAYITSEQPNDTEEVTEEQLTEEETSEYAEEDNSEISEEEITEESETEIIEEPEEEITAEEAETVQDETTEISRDYPYNPTEVLILTGNEGLFREDDLDNILSSYEGLYLLQYNSTEEADEAVGYYTGLADFVGINNEAFEVSDDEYVDDSTEEAAEQPEDEATEEIRTEEAAETVTEEDNNEIPVSEDISTSPINPDEDNAIAILNDVINDGVNGKGKIALIDTGVNGNNYESISVIGDSTADDNGHGTAMYNFIKEEYPAAEVISIKALGANGKGQASDIYAALEYAIEHNVDIINLSLSAYAMADNAIIEQKINEAISKGIIVVGAVGNKGMDARLFIPSKIDGAVIVGGLNADGSVLSNSNYGATLDYLTYGASSSEATARLTGMISRYGIDGLLGTGKVFTNEYTEVDSLDDLDIGDIEWIVPAEFRNPEFEINYTVGSTTYPDSMVANISIGGISTRGAYGTTVYLPNVDTGEWTYYTRGTDLRTTLNYCNDYDSANFSLLSCQAFCTKHSSHTPPATTGNVRVFIYTPETTEQYATYYAGGWYLAGTGYQSVGLKMVIAPKPENKIYVSLRKYPEGSSGNGYIPDTTGIVYTVVEGTADHSVCSFILGPDGTPANIVDGDHKRLVVDASNYFEYTHNEEIDGILYAVIDCHRTNSDTAIWNGALYLKETATNGNYWLDTDADGKPVYHPIPEMNAGEFYLLTQEDKLTDKNGAIQVLKVDQNGDYVGGAEYTLYKGNTPIATKTTSSQEINKGLATFTNLEAGTYKVKETKAPTGYLTDNTVYTVNINLDGTIGAEEDSWGYVFDYSSYLNNLSSAQQEAITGVFGNDVYGYFNHWYYHGCNEGKRASVTFDPVEYIKNNPDLASFGSDYIRGAKHYQTNGANENRKTLLKSEYDNMPTGTVRGNSTGLVIVKSEDTKPSYVKLKKQTSAGCSEIVADNPNYSLEGAQFKIYKNNACTQPLTNNTYDFITDANGDTTAINISQYISIGSSTRLYIKEIKASKGYNLNASPTYVDVTPANMEDNPALVTIDETPQDDPAVIVLTKKDSENDEPIEGAIYEIKYYAAETESQINDTTYRRHWFLRTDNDGWAALNISYLTSLNGNSSDDFYYNESERPTFPLGYITIQEVEAPVEYVIDSTLYTYKVTDNMLRTVATNEAVEPTVSERPKKQAFQLVKLAEDGTSDLKPLANAGFMAWKVSDLSTDSSGNYIFDTSKAVALARDGSKEMFTDEDGYALSAELRYGTYIVRETTIPAGYNPVADFTVTITEDSSTPQRIVYKTDTQKKYYLRVTKIDSLTNNAVLNNSSSYKIWSYDDNAYVSFRTYTGSRFEQVSEFKTDNSGILMTPGTLTYGSYRLVETTAPEGYNMDYPDGIDFTIDDSTIYVTVEDEGDIISIVDVVYEDTPIFGKLNLVKTGEVREWDETSGDFKTKAVPLSDIEFGIYAAEDIYTSDGAGTIIYTEGDLAYTITTDEKGKASQNNLPLGKYVVKELNTPDDFIKVDDVNIEFKLSDKKQDAEGVYYVEQKAEILNKAYYPKVKTTAVDSATKEHTGIAGEKVTVVDKVACTDLVVGREYTVKGQLYDTSTGEVYIDNNGDEVTAELTFTAESKNQTVDLEFTYNSTDLAGETIVVFETLFYNDKVVALHTDLSDTEQQIHYVDVKTTALDSETGTHTGVVGDKVTVIDKVACTNLIKGKEYTIKGKLYNTETGGAVLDDDKEVTAELTFTAEEENPTIDLEFTLNSKTLSGETIVVFEDLYVNSIKVATHSDLTDENQQISYPTVATKAVDKDTDSKSGVVGEDATIVDTVDCKNLVVGEEYTVKGKLYDTASGEVFLDNGREVTAEKTFKADKKDMTVELTFTFNSTALEGKITTVFEDLYSNNKKVAAHSDISDREQQVDYPRVKTTAKDKTTGSHTGIIAEKVTIVDTVECTNLIIGKEYTVKGKLYNTETGEVFLDSGQEVTAEKTFKADKKNMTVELEFTFNSTSLIGETIVVFEDLYHKGIKVNSHSRLDDKDQQVKYPRISTTFKNAVDGGKVISPKTSVTLNDTVKIENVAVGDRFVLRGIIYDKSTGEKLIINDNEVPGYNIFMSDNENMSIDVIFTFDASSLAGKDIVCYEYLYLIDENGNEILIAEHTDINDAGQTITFITEPPTPKTGDNIMTFVLLMILSAGFMLVMITGRRINTKRKSK